MGKAIPETLLKQIADDKIKEVEEDSFNNFNPDQQDDNSYEQNINNTPLQQMRIQRPYYNIQPPRPPPPPNKYSPQYAAYVGARPRAQASARIGLGGAF
jgi:hypothetical protein